MAKMTLLEMTQNILESMESDPANSIDDTEESIMVANIIRITFFDMMASREWPFLYSLTTLTALADVNNPTKFDIPDTINRVVWMKYNDEDVTYMAPKDFYEMIKARDTSLANVDANGYITDRDPLYWTTYDDQRIEMDSYDQATESTLQQSNLTAYCVTAPSWTHTDAFTPAIPEKMFSTLLAEAKAVAFLQVKQMRNPVHEQRARQGRSRLQSEARKAQAQWNTNGVNYGRK